SGGLDGTARLWSIATGEGRVLEGSAGSIFGLAFSPDNRRLAASSGATGALILWDLDTGAHRVIQSPGGAMVDGVAFSPDGRALAYADTGHAARLLDPGSGRELSSLKTEDACMAVAFSPDGARLAASGAFSHVQLWDLGGGASGSGEGRPLEGHKNTTPSL